MRLALLTGALLWPPVGSGQEPTPVSFRPAEDYATSGGVAVSPVGRGPDPDLVVAERPVADGSGGTVAAVLGAKAGSDALTGLAVAQHLDAPDDIPARHEAAPYAGGRKT